MEATKAAEDLENRVAEATIEGHELHAHARELAAELRGRPRIADDAGKEPRPGLDGVEAWSEIARASLFVARGQLSAEREAVIRQANELGALALGEPLSAMGTVLSRAASSGRSGSGKVPRSRDVSLVRGIKFGRFVTRSGDSAA